MENQAQTTITVEQGSPIYSINQALEMIGRGGKGRIYLKSGRYHEKILCQAGDIEIIGEDPLTTIIEFGDGAKHLHSDGTPNGTFRSYTAFFIGERLTLKNLTIENTAGHGVDVGQAIAAAIDVRSAYCENVRFCGRQDTLFTAPLPESVRQINGFKGPTENTERLPSNQHYKNCYIEGDIDFIFGGANALFEECEIRVLDRPYADISGYIAAPCTDPDELGYLFYRCRITTDADRKTYYLGRPWREDGACAFVRCDFSASRGVFFDEGFSAWNNDGKDRPRFFVTGDDFTDDTNILYGKKMSDEAGEQLFFQMKKLFTSDL